MSLIDDLRTLRTSPQKIFFDYLLNVEKSEPTLHIFMEGKTDFSFYGTLIQRTFNHQIKVEPEVCGNKKSVIEARKKILARPIPNQYSAFFVDKDVDDIIGNEFDLEGIHETEYYSMESYLICSKLFRSTIMELFRLQGSQAQFDTLHDKFVNLNSAFCRWAEDLMAWIIFARAINADPCLSNIKMKDLINITDELEFEELLNKEELYCYLHETAKCHFTPLQNGIEKTKDTIKDKDPRQYIRGKYHIWIMTKAINKAKACLEQANDQKIKLHVNVTDENILDILAPRIKMIQSIENYLKEIVSTPMAAV